MPPGPLGDGASGCSGLGGGAGVVVVPVVVGGSLGVVVVVPVVGVVVLGGVAVVEGTVVAEAGSSVVWVATSLTGGVGGAGLGAGAATAPGAAPSVGGGVSAAMVVAGATGAGLTFLTRFACRWRPTSSAAVASLASPAVLALTGCSAWWTTTGSEA